MRLFDRWLVIAAYLILVGSVAWSTREINKGVEDVQQEACIAAIGSVALFATPGFLDAIIQDPEDAIEVVEIIEIAQARCSGVLGLDL